MTLMKEIEGDTDGKTYCVPGLEELLLLQRQYSWQSTDFSANPIKCQWHFS